MNGLRKLLLGIFFAGGLALVGCDAASSSSGSAAKPKHDHSGWWCDEHALPEEICDLCSKKYREAEKAKGNWCEHDRVKTSCFKCNPGLQEKWAKEYEARNGKKPPEPEPEVKK